MLFQPTSEWAIILATALGEGSTGAVYKGFLEEKEVAVKVVEILYRYDDWKRWRLGLADKSVVPVLSSVRRDY
jgi:hypothetical protein